LSIFRAILEFFFGITNNWGWSIIILTVLIKLILFPTTIKQFKVMAKMKDLQPKLKEIQDKYKDKPEEYQRRTMELYKNANVNPLSGCLPMLIQLPILILFYNALQDPKYVAEVIKDASFYGIILKENHNLALAVVSAVTTFLQSKLTTPAAGGDSQQQTFLYIMPLMIGYFTWQINSGVGLYWVTSNIIGIFQQYLLMSTLL